MCTIIIGNIYYISKKKNVHYICVFIIIFTSESSFTTHTCEREKNHKQVRDECSREIVKEGEREGEKGRDDTTHIIYRRAPNALNKIMLLCYASCAALLDRNIVVFVIIFMFVVDSVSK